MLIRNKTPQSALTTARPIALRCLPVFALCLAITACDTPSQETTPAESASSGKALSLSAYRVRTDADAGLNDEVWAGKLNSPANVLADQPFRLRVEIEKPEQATTSNVFSLQYRRNDGDWEALTAEDFPYPTKNVTLDFSGPADHQAVSQLHLAQGQDNALVWQEVVGDNYLRLDSGDQPLLVLGNYQTYWEAQEFKAVLRLGEAARAGLLFGYQDVENYYRLDVEGAGPISVIHRQAGRDRIIETLNVTVKADRWIEVAVIREGNEIGIEYEWDPVIEGMAWTVGLASPVDATVTGFYLAEHHSVDVSTMEVSAEAQSPRASIVSSGAYAHGAATSDLLPGSELPFTAGAGINFAPHSPPWSAAAAQGEWEFPIVLRYFSDGALTNRDGDRFEFRVVDQAGTPIAAAHLPGVMLQVPQGHLGGTFVETPGRLGPWQTADGNLYFLMEPSETDNMMMIVRSRDEGASWLESDGANRPATGDLEGVATAFDGARIHILHQTSDEVLYHVFRTSADEQGEGWEIRDEHLASPTEPPVQVADLALRSDGSVVGIYGDLHKLRYRIRTPEGDWGEARVVEPDTNRDLSGPVLARANDDSVHLAYTGFDGTAWYRRILPNGELTTAQLVADGLGKDVEDAGGILPLVYLPAANTVSVVYRLDNGELWERRAGAELSPAVQVTDRAVARNAADSEQVGADAIAHGDHVHVLFIEADSGRLYHTWRDATGDWTEPDPVVVDENVLWVRGALVTRSDGRAVYGFVYDGGSQGGSGMNRYREISLNRVD